MRRALLGVALVAAAALGCAPKPDTTPVNNSTTELDVSIPGDSADASAPTTLVTLKVPGMT